MEFSKSTRLKTIITLGNRTYNHDGTSKDFKGVGCSNKSCTDKVHLNANNEVKQ